MLAKFLSTQRHTLSSSKLNGTHNDSCNDLSQINDQILENDQFSGRLPVKHLKDLGNALENRDSAFRVAQRTLKVPRSELRVEENQSRRKYLARATAPT
jgi:hypothetical protein